MGNIAIMFPGVGTQYEYMGQQLLRNICARKIFEEASEVVNINLIALMSGTEMNHLQSSEIIQPLLVTYGYSVYAILKEFYNINIFLGHSLGEITALTCAGYIDFKSAIRFSMMRGKVYEAARGCGETAVVIGIEENILKEKIEYVSKTVPVYITGFNTESQFLVAGSSEGIKKMGEALKDTSAMFVPYSLLPMRDKIPVHCELMKQIQGQKLWFEDEIKITDSILLSSVSGTQYTSESEIRDNLSRQLYSPIKWRQAVDRLMLWEPTMVIDSGPQRILKDFFCEGHNDTKAEAFSADVRVDYEKLMERGR